MKIWPNTLPLWLLTTLLALTACTEPAPTADATERAGGFVAALENHLNAVSTRDLATLRSTLSPEGNMQLILPGSEILYSVDSFMNYHEEWFRDTSWSFATEILSTEVGTDVGTGTVEATYREPERDGVPYFNRMVVSYALRRIDGNWYVISDHASSSEKSTD